MISAGLGTFDAICQFKAGVGSVLKDLGICLKRNREVFDSGPKLSL